MDLTAKQQLVYDELIKFVNQKKKRELILVGYAGTGKTTLISKFINDICSNNICNKVVLAAPTHKAVNIAKSKINIINNTNDKSKKKIEIMTIHRLLNYQNFIDSTNGTRYFAKSLVDPNWTIYDLIIIDECSMLNEQLINDINSELQKTPNIKIIYVGDSAQLPPVNEETSKIFDKQIDKLYLDEIIRTKSAKIMELSQSHRFWIEGKAMPELSKYSDDNIIIYPYKYKNIWLKRFLKCHSDKNLTNAIILCWTNKNVNAYNDYIRQKKFGSGTLNKYEIGEIIIFNDFHVIKEINEDNKEKKIAFHTSEQVKVNDVKESMHFVDLFGKINSNILNKDVIKIINDGITKMNKQLNSFQIYDLSVTKLDSDKIYNIKTIHKNSTTNYSKLIEFVTEYIMNIKTNAFKYIDSSKDTINKCELVAELEKKMNSIWKAFHMILSEPFAELNYGYAITVHKSQGSTFDNVFIDLSDILDNQKDIEMKKCLYTAITRSANKINILI